MCMEIVIFHFFCEIWLHFEGCMEKVFELLKVFLFLLFPPGCGCVFAVKKIVVCFVG